MIGHLMNMKYYASPSDLLDDKTASPIILHEKNGKHLFFLLLTRLFWNLLCSTGWLSNLQASGHMYHFSLPRTEVVCVNYPAGCVTG